MSMNTTMLAMWTPGLPELLVIGVVALLIFGRRLPEVGRSLGRSIVEFKKGVREAKDQIDLDTTIDERPSSLPRKDQPQGTAGQSGQKDAESSRSDFLQGK